MAGGPGLDFRSDPNRRQLQGRLRVRLFVNVIALIFATLISALAFGSEPKTGKLVGHVDIGPLSPVERPGPKPTVPPEMYKRYTVQILQPGPHNERMRSHLLRLVTELKLTDKGDFSVDLIPGEYRVGIKSTQPMIHAPTDQFVTISAGKTTKIAIRIDTGIR